VLFGLEALEVEVGVEVEVGGLDGLVVEDGLEEVDEKELEELERVDEEDEVDDGVAAAVPCKH